MGKKKGKKDSKASDEGTSKSQESTPQPSPQETLKKQGDAPQHGEQSDTSQQTRRKGKGPKVQDTELDKSQTQSKCPPQLMPSTQSAPQQGQQMHPQQQPQFQQKPQQKGKGPKWQATERDRPQTPSAPQQGQQMHPQQQQMYPQQQQMYPQQQQMYPQQQQMYLQQQQMNPQQQSQFQQKPQQKGKGPKWQATAHDRPQTPSAPQQGQQMHPQQQQMYPQQQQTNPQQQPQQKGFTVPPAQQKIQYSQQQMQPQQKKPEFQQKPFADKQAQGSPVRDITQQMAKTRLSPELENRSLVKAIPGTKGRRINIEVNHLKLNLGTLKSAIHYDVNIVPDTPKRFMRSVMEKFREIYYPNRYPAFDGRKNLYSTNLLPFGQTIAGTVTIKEQDSDRNKEYKVEIQYANEVDLTPLRNLMSSVETPREALQVVDIVLRMAPASRCIPLGRSFFVKPPNIIELGEGMEMYSGFYQSAIRGWRPYLNIDVAHKAFPKNIRVTDAIIELFDSRWQKFEARDLEAGLDQRQKETFQKFINQLRVVYEIPNNPSSKRCYRVIGVKECAKDKTFKLDNGQTMTIEQYFSTEKRYRLRYPRLPTLWVGSRQREILVPAELCTIIEGQAVIRKMTENQTSAMIKHAATSTNVRKEKIQRALTQAAHNSDKTVKEFGFSVSNEFEKLEARILPPPILGYANNKQVTVSKGVWRNEKFLQGKQINKWTISIADRRLPRPEELTNMANMILRNAGPCGMTINNDAIKPFAPMGLTYNEIRKYFETAKGQGFDIIFVVVPNQGPQYSWVKKAAELNVGCLTQCVKMKTLGKMNPQTVTNILLKVNSKLNGTNHALLTRPAIMNRPCMIMGADVTHPSPDSQGIPSVAAVTASHDPKAFCYNICWRLQPPKVEIIEDLEQITREHLEYFYQATKLKPERIVFFRDGVSEGQFDQVKRAEIMAIRKACKSVQASDYEPSITFIVVQKRHHTRMFPLNPRDSEDRNNNVPAGTCVDTDITHPFMQDFYLVSHASIQGVAKPTKYCTLWDDNKMSNDDIEELAYFLCHLFTRCNRSVSYPAPTYYAHLAAARAKVYIETESININDLKREMEKYKILDVIRKDLPMFFV